MEEKDNLQLPENAFRELKDGEEYKPLMSPDKVYPEVNGWSVTWGIVMAVIFSAAAAYLGLKVGQVFEAAIPIAIIAVGVSTATKRSKALGENVIIQSIGACSGAVVAGAIFTLPAIYILQAKYPEMTTSFMKIFMASALGGVLGILFLIPFRKYFVSDMHGKYPFPEATATTQVLVSGAKGGDQAKPLLIAGLVGGLYDFIVASLGWWNENFTSRVVSLGCDLADKAKLVFKVNTGAAVLGLGYIIGLKYAFFTCLGSLVVWWLIVPGMSVIFHDSVLSAWDPSIVKTVGAMSPEEIFRAYARSIGIGGIAMAGIIGIIKSWGIIKSAVGLAAREMKGKGAGGIVAGYHHGAVYEVDHAQLLVVRELHKRTALVKVAADIYFFFEVIAQLKSKYGGHYLCGAGGVRLGTGVLFIEHRAGVGVHEAYMLCSRGFRRRLRKGGRHQAYDGNKYEHCGNNALQG